MKAGLIIGAIFWALAGGVYYAVTHKPAGPPRGAVYVCDTVPAGKCVRFPS